MSYRVEPLPIVLCGLSTLNTQADGGTIDGLRNIKVETVKLEMFSIPEDYRRVESQLTGLHPESAMTFGAADQQRG